MGDPFFFAILQEDWHFGQSTEDARRRLFMSQVVVWSSLVRTCVIRSLKVQDRGVDERTGGGAGAAGGGGAVGGAVGAVGAVAIGGGGAVGAVAIEMDIVDNSDRIVDVHCV